MLLTALALSLLGDIAPPPPPVAPKRPPPPAACRADTDCRLSTFAGCCPGCCQPPPHAVPVGTREGEVCAAVDCARPDCSMVRCAHPDVSDWVAACAGGRCVAQPRRAECRVDADCRVVEVRPEPCAGPCGCCPVSQAMPVDTAVPLQRRAPPKPDRERRDAAPPFGLSTGGAPRPDAPQCSPCPAPAPGRATCQAGRCALVPLEPPPRPRPPIPG